MSQTLGRKLQSLNNGPTYLGPNPGTCECYVCGKKLFTDGIQ